MTYIKGHNSVKPQNKINKISLCAEEKSAHRNNGTVRFGGGICLISDTVHKVRLY